MGIASAKGDRTASGLLLNLFNFAFLYFSLFSLQKVALYPPVYFLYKE